LKLLRSWRSQSDPASLCTYEYA